MVDLQFFIIEEGFTTFWTPTCLSLGKLLFGKCQVFGFRCLPFHPVVCETRIIWRCRSLDQHMPLYREPAKLEQVSPCLCVSKHPGVQSIKLEPSPIGAVPQSFGFLGSLPPPLPVSSLAIPS